VKLRNLQKQGNALPHIGECRALFFSLERVFKDVLANKRARGNLVVKALRYKPAGRGFDSRWCHWNFSVT